MLTLFATIVLLSVLILVHEFGHFLAAKSVDIEVRRFSLGMGPRVAGFRHGETEFILSALPIGGYVSMAGMADDETEVLQGSHGEERQASARDFDSKPLWARVWVISAGVLMNFLFAVLVFAGIAFFYGDRVIPTTQVTIEAPETLPGGAAPLTQVPSGAQIVAVNERPVENWNEVQRELIHSSPGPVELRFADASPVTFQMPIPDSLRLAVVSAIQPLLEPVVREIQPGSAAQAAGMQPGDRVLAAGGAPIRTWGEFQETIRGYPGQPLPLQIERNGQIIELTVTPDAFQEPRTEAGPIGRLGVSPEVRRSVGAGESVVRGFQETGRYSTMIVNFLGNLFTGHESPRQVGSLLTIGQLSGEFARTGLQSFLWFMAVFSINLAVLNLLPIPILDGGHLMFMAIEAVRGRPLSVEQRIRLSHVGLIIVVGIMVWAMTNDVLRLFGI